MKFGLYFAILHVIACIVHAISAYVASYYHLKYDEGDEQKFVKGFPLRTQTYELQFANETSSASVVQGDVLWDLHVSPITLLVWNELITSAFHLFGFVLYLMWSECGMQSRAMIIVLKFRRWVEYAITAYLIEAAIFLCQGVTDPATHIFVFVLNLILQFIGALTELDLFQSEQEDVELARSFTRCSLTAVLHNLLGYAVLIPPVWFAFDNNSRGAKVDEPLLVFFTISYASFGIYQTIRFFVDFSVMPRRADNEGFGRRCRSRFNPEAMFTLFSVTTKLVLTWYVVLEANIVYREASTDPNPEGSLTADELRNTGLPFAVWLPLSLFVILVIVNAFFGKGDFSDNEQQERNVAISRRNIGLTFPARAGYKQVDDQLNF